MAGVVDKENGDAIGGGGDNNPPEVVGGFIQLAEENNNPQGGAAENGNVVAPVVNVAIPAQEVEVNEEEMPEEEEMPPPVDAINGEQEPMNKKPRRDQNFTITCTGADISDDLTEPTIYHFDIFMKRSERTYEVEVATGDFHNAHFKWSKQIKCGFLYCPGTTNAFVEQIKEAILDYEDQRAENGEDAGMKRKLKLKQETVVEIDSKVYFISGKCEVYLFTPEVFPYTRKLDEEEIENLPVKIVFEGKEKSYIFDPKEVFEKFLKLIKDFNSIQRQQHQSSFTYACLQNMKTELYMVVEDHRIPILFCHATNAGKSMALLVNDRIYNTKEYPQIYSSCSEAGLKGSLKSGRVSRFDEIDKSDSGSVLKMLKCVWPSGGGKIQTGYGNIQINTTAMISTNSYPDELMQMWRMSHADLTKFDFNFFGETSMEHVRDDFQQILDSCLVQGDDLNYGKPLLLGIGFKVIKGRATGEEIAKFDGIVGNRNQRFTQGMCHLEKFCKLLVDMANTFEIPEECVPSSVLQPTYNCILKAKDTVAQQAERKASDLISEVCKDPEEARKCLLIPSKGRKGVGIITSRLKDAPMWKPWMQRIINKLPELDTVDPDGRRIRGRLVPLDELDGTFPFVNELFSLTVEKILPILAKEHNQKKKRALIQLKDNMRKLGVPNDAGINLDVEEGGLFIDDDDWNDDQFDEDLNLDFDDDRMEDMEEGGGLKYQGGYYWCKLCKGSKKKYKTKGWANAHIKKYH